MKRRKVLATFMSLILAGQMAFTAIPVYALEDDSGGQIEDSGGSGEVSDPDASNKPMADGNKLRMWYTSPGTQGSWESTSLVIGNGKTGGILFGQVGKDQIHFNEKTLWSGGPSEYRTNYDGGNRDTAVTKEQLDAVREKMDDHSSSVFPMGTKRVDEVWGDGAGMGMYQDFGDLFLDFSATGMTNNNVENYVRDLDMTTGISSLNYDYEGVHYEREYFASHPDGVVVTRLTASENGKISFTASVQASGGLSTTTSAQDGKITLSGTVRDNQMKCEMQAKVIADGGVVTTNENGTVTVEGADAATIIYDTDTDYKNDYPTYRTGETAEELSNSITETIDAAAQKNYESLRASHVLDYSELFGRVDIDLGGECSQKPTNEMMADYRDGNTDHVLEEMIYQFGRYLTIEASREGDELPSNLCGIWMIGGASSYWGADFHFNVNVQMNYWPAYQTNLAECGSVFTDYVESLVEPGRVTADKSAAMKTDDVENTPIGEGNGFLVNTQNNPFGCTAPFGSQEYGWNITGSSWALQNIYDQYLYTQDTELLENTIYPMLKEMTNFWDGFLWWSDYQDRLVVGPSFSAEQGPTVNGSTYDQSLVWELYDMAIDASERLGIDEDERAEWKETQDKLNPIIIGEEGQVKEWFEETTTGKAQAGDLEEVNIPNFGAGGSANQGSLHRHTSQLIGLYPGTLVNKDNKEWMDAAKKTLELRNLGGTGWSKAHKINMWARTGDAETTYKLINAMIKGNKNGILDNFLDSHPPFQIDGNYGLTAGINECLLQSQLGYTQFLPAVSETWESGSVNGIVARGNFVIGMDWSGNSADRFTITARSGGTFTGEYDNLAAYTVKKSDGTEVETTKLSDDKISFQTEVGETYTIDFNMSSTKLQMNIDEAKNLSEQMTDDIFAVQKTKLDSLISAAEKVVENQDSSQYYTQAQTLSKAIKIATSVLKVKDPYNNAKRAYDERNVEEDWASYVTAVNDLKNQMDAAAELLKKEEVSSNEVEAMAQTLDSRREDLEGIWDRLIVKFNPESGQLDGEGKVEISSDFNDLQIRYTTDGNDPMWFSDIYTEPFTITQSKATVKAALYLGNRQLSDVFSTEYVGSLDTKDLAQKNSSYTDEGNATGRWSGPDRALDGKNGKSWSPKTVPATLTLSYDEPITINALELTQGWIYSGYCGVKSYCVEYWNGNEWVTIVNEESGVEISKVTMFDEITSDKIRLSITAFDGQTAEIDAFRLFYLNDEVTTDKSALDLVLGIAKVNIDNGTVAEAIESVQESFNKVYEYAKVVSENVNSSQTTIDETTKALIAELQKLGFKAGDKTQLMQHYQLYSVLDLNDYLDGAEKDAFVAALETAKAVIDNGDAMQTEVTEADQALVETAAALIKKADKSALQALVDTTADYNKDNYLAEGWNTFESARNHANEILEKEDATQEEVDTAKLLLVQAMASLRYKADKSVLEEVIEKAKAMDLTGYSETNIAIFKTALTAAETVMANENLSVYDQPIVDGAVLDLQNAIAALEAEKGNPSNPTDPSEPGNNGNGGNSGNSGNNGNSGNSGNAGNNGNGNNTGSDKNTGSGSNGTIKTTTGTTQKGSSTTTATSGKATKTGDAAPIAGLLAVMLGSAVAAIVVVRKKRNL